MPNPPASLYLAPGVLQRLDGGTFFYPCAGGDFQVPLALFAPVLADFWFVDCDYFRSRHRDAGHRGLDPLLREVPPLLADHPDYRLLHRGVEGDAPLSEHPRRAAGSPAMPPLTPTTSLGAGLSDRWARPLPRELILTEHYLHLASGRNVRIHRCRGDAREVFEREPRLAVLSVFFYRGDSAGDGGSGIRWLGERLERAVLERLRPGGLFVSDGSDGAMYPQRAPSGFRNPAIRGVRHDVAHAVATVDPIQAAGAQILQCVGYAGQHYGPTLVWQKPPVDDDDGIEAPGWTAPARRVSRLPHRPDAPESGDDRSRDRDARAGRTDDAPTSSTPKLDAIRRAIQLAPFDEEE